MTNIEDSKFEEIFKNVNSLKASIVRRLNINYHYSDSDFFLIKVADTNFILKINISSKIHNDSYKYKKLTEDMVAETKILNILKGEFIEKNITPCILELVFSKTTTLNVYDTKNCEKYYKSFAENIDEYVDEMFCRMNRLVKKDIYKNIIHFNVMEVCNLSLANMIKHLNLADIPFIKTLLFQILYTLYVITKKYPNFHHADLHLQNIMLVEDIKYKMNIYNPDTLVYNTEFNGNKKMFIVPYFGIIPKIIDFGFSTLGTVRNVHTASKFFNYNRIKNDFLWLLHHMYIDLQDNVYNSLLIDMFNELDPKQRYIRLNLEYVELNESNNLEEYECMLQCDLFKEYQNVESKNINILHTFDQL